MIYSAPTYYIAQVPFGQCSNARVALQLQWRAEIATRTVFSCFRKLTANTHGFLHKDRQDPPLPKKPTFLDLGIAGECRGSNSGVGGFQVPLLDVRMRMPEPPSHKASGFCLSHHIPSSLCFSASFTTRSKKPQPPREERDPTTSRHGHDEYDATRYNGSFSYHQ